MIVRIAALSLVLCFAGAASQTVCLKSSFCFQSESLTQSGQTVKLHVGGGEIEVQRSEIASIEENPAQADANIPSPAKVTSSRDLVAQAAASQGLDPDFVGSVAAVESGFARGALSSKGALGLMQLMPATARALGVNPDLANENALGGAKYLRELLLKYHSNSALALAAYNAGPGAVSRFGGVPPFAETRHYIRRVTREYDRRHSATVSKAKRTPEVKQTAPSVSLR